MSSLTLSSHGYFQDPIKINNKSLLKNLTMRTSIKEVVLPYIFLLEKETKFRN